jgi:predicted phage terminase large subunit-like protein
VAVAPIKKITAKLVEGFLSGFLVPYLDDPQPTPAFHREMWGLVCSDAKYVAIAAPRGHAKSTGVTNAYVLTSVLFGESTYVLIISETWDKAVEFLGGLTKSLKDNVEINRHFGPITFEKDSQDEIVVKTRDTRFKIAVYGAEQSTRGALWEGRVRPNLIIADDMENDELVSNKDRRTRYKKAFMNVTIPCGSRRCKYRIIGTILHFDSLLENFLKDTAWESRRYKAHEAMNDFSNILWPELWPEERLRQTQSIWRGQHNLDGYSQEFLNIPVSSEDQYFREEDFLPMTEEDKSAPGTYYAAADLAVSVKERADYTVIGVMKITADGFHHVVDVRRFKRDSLEVIEELLSVQKRYSPELFGIEAGQIKLAIGPFLDVKMRERGIFLNMERLSPAGDKPTRGKSFQGMMKAGAVKFDKEASWFEELHEELMKMTNSGAKSGHDDQFDVVSYLGMMSAKFGRPDTEGEEEEDKFYASFLDQKSDGRNAITGY